MVSNRREVPPSRYPPGFDDWDLDTQVHHLTVIYSREGLIRLSLSLSRWDATRQDIDSQTRLTKEQLAAIVLALDPDRQSPSHDNAWD